jgi:hypothetical protein
MEVSRALSAAILLAILLAISCESGATTPAERTEEADMRAFLEKWSATQTPAEMTATTIAYKQGTIAARTRACQGLLVEDLGNRLSERIADEITDSSFGYEGLAGVIKPILQDTLCSSSNVNCSLLGGNDRSQWSLCFHER